MIDPIRRSIVVTCAPDQAFRVFTDEMGTWWPFEHSLGGTEGPDRAVGVVIEARAGGRIMELQAGGGNGSWGEVLTWDPPGRLVLAWKPNDTPAPPTELEVTFTAVDDGTRVDLEHRGWERLGDLGEQGRSEYDQGWPSVFDQRFAGAANAAAG